MTDRQRILKEYNYIYIYIIYILLENSLPIRHNFICLDFTGWPGGCSHFHDFVIMHTYETATVSSTCASSIVDSAAITTPSIQISKSQTRM